MKRTVSLLLLAAFLGIGAASADEDSSCGGKENRCWLAWQVQEENDAAAVFSGSDDSYTQGLLIRFWRHPNFTPNRLRGFARKIETLIYRDRKAFETAVGFQIGQHIFTPETLKPKDLILDDRPYAGLLYGSLLFTLTEDRGVEARPVQQFLELQVGLTGPNSGAEWAQTTLHKIIDDEKPMGWDHQLPQEFHLNLYYQWRKRFGSESFDFVPNLALGLGTIQIYAGAGMTVRGGFNISDFGPVANTSSVAPRKERPETPWEGYLFVGGEGRAVGHNLFLDGSLYRDSHSVDKETLVYDLKAGFSLRYKRWRLTYTFVRRSQEFEPIPMISDGRGEHDFGSINFTFLLR